MNDILMLGPVDSLMDGNNMKRTMNSDSEDEIVFSIKKKKKLVISDEEDNSNSGDTLAKQYSASSEERSYANAEIISTKVNHRCNSEDEDEMPLRSISTLNTSTENLKKNSLHPIVSEEEQDDDDDLPLFKLSSLGDQRIKMVSQKEEQNKKSLHPIVSEEQNDDDDDDDEVPLFKLSSLSDQRIKMVSQEKPKNGCSPDENIQNSQTDADQSVPSKAAKVTKRRKPREKKSALDIYERKNVKSKKANKHIQEHSTNGEVELVKDVQLNNVLDEVHARETPENVKPAQVRKSRKKNIGNDLKKKPKKLRRAEIDLENEQLEEFVPIHLDKDLFDADEPDSDEPVTTEMDGTWMDSEYIPDIENVTKRKAKAKKKSKEQTVRKSVQEKELFSIQSENARLKREMSVKLPCRKNSIYSLEEFLKVRKNQIYESPSNEKLCSKAVENSNAIHSDSPATLTAEVEIHNNINEKEEIITAETINNAVEDKVEDEKEVASILIDYMLNTISNTCEMENAEKLENIASNILLSKSDDGVLNGTACIISNRLDNEKADELQESREGIIMEEACVNFHSFQDAKTNEPATSSVDELHKNNTTDVNNYQMNINCTSSNDHSKSDNIPAVERHLSTPEDGFVYLDVEDYHDTESNKTKEKALIQENDFHNFIEKFVTHTKETSKKNVHQEVKLSIVTKDESKAGDFQMSEIYVDVSRKEDEKPDKPGAKLAKLKGQLLDKIWKKKEETLLKKKELEQLDEEIPDDEEDEAELSDSESDVDESHEIAADEEEEVSEDDDDVDIATSSKKKTACAFIDDEASESNNSLNVYGDLNSETSNQSKNSENSRTDFCGIFPKCNSFDQEEQLESKTDGTSELLASQKNEQSRLLYLDSDSEDNVERPEKSLSRSRSFDISASAIPSYQPDGGFSHLKNSQGISSSHCENENSVRTQHSDKADELSQLDSSEQHWSSQNPHTSAITGEFYINLKSPTHVASLINNVPSTQSNTDDLLFLCSGKFVESQDEPLVSPEKDIVNVVEKDEPALDQVINTEMSLNSDSISIPVSSKGTADPDTTNKLDCFDIAITPHPDLLKVAEANQVLKPAVNTDDGLELHSETLDARRLHPIEKPSQDDDQFDTTSLDSPPHAGKKTHARILSDSEDEVDDVSVPAWDMDDELSVKNHPSNNDDLDDVDDVMLEEMECLSEVGIKKVSDYFEDEAELSGSDVGSDADEDVDEDGYLEDLIHEGEGYSEEALRNQIGKVHMKKLMDEDKRQLRLYQELYLENGDLHTDGPGRLRKFTWRNSGSQQPFANQDAESESEAEDAPEEEKWRRERHEREKWLRDNEQKNNDLDSSLVSTPPSCPFKLEIVNKSLGSTSFTVAESPLNNNSTSSYQIEMKRGSLLARGEAYLSSMAKKMKKIEGDSIGSKTTRHFVFRAVSPKKRESAAAIPTSQPKMKPVMKTVVSKKRKSVFDFI